MRKETDNEQSSKIVDNIKAFIRHHPTKGTRPRPVQDAVDAILVAATFCPEKTVSVFQIADSFGVSRQTVEKCKERGAEMQVTGTAFKPADRKQRADCIRPEATMAVHEFCHSEEGSNVDTESYRIMKLLNVNTNKIDGHPLRVWHEMTNKTRFMAFKESSVYKEFRDTHGDAEIGEEVFRLTVCPCVRNPGPQSCVDLLFSGLQLYMTAIDNALKHNIVIKNKVKMCECERHQKVRRANDRKIKAKAREDEAKEDGAQDYYDDSDEDEESNDEVNWESLLVGRAVDLIKATCCPEVEEPMLCSEVDGKPPRVIPWRCTHRSDAENYQCCGGVANLLKVADCRTFSQCAIPIPVFEWKLAPRAGTNSNGQQNTQIELTESKEPLNTIVQRLGVQLEKFRTHHNELI
jgi:hypothetical protein